MPKGVSNVSARTDGGNANECGAAGLAIPAVFFLMGKDSWGKDA